uniref:Uncharacterized protein n=1 Tax=Poecilia reticulata TaxID=8081 RepID=A0A3P9PHN2_POERE
MRNQSIKLANDPNHTVKLVTKGLQDNKSSQSPHLSLIPNLWAELERCVCFQPDTFVSVLEHQSYERIKDTSTVLNCV